MDKSCLVFYDSRCISLSIRQNILITPVAQIGRLRMFYSAVYVVFILRFHSPSTVLCKVESIATIITCDNII